MIIGKGLIASIFLKNNFLDDNYIIFASGVSNSQEVLPEAFDREFDLIKSLANTSKCFIYFSTISIFDPGLQQNQYIQHKANVERFISNHFKNYIIFRLGQVIGKTKNPKLISNFLFSHISNQTSFDLWTGAERIFMDIEDVYKLVKYFMHPNHNKSIINLVHNKRLPVSELVKYFETILQVKPIFRNVPIDSKAINFKNELCMNAIKELKLLCNSADYVFECLKKYYG